MVQPITNTEWEATFKLDGEMSVDEIKDDAVYFDPLQNFWHDVVLSKHFTFLDLFSGYKHFL